MNPPADTAGSITSEVTFPIRTYRIINGRRTLAPATIPKAYTKQPGHEFLRMSDLYDDEELSVELPLSSAQGSDRFQLIWQGRVTWESEIQAVGAPGVKVVRVPRREFIDNVGLDVQVTYVITDTTGTPHTSERLTVTVDPYPYTLVPPQIHDKDVTVQYSGQSGTHIARVDVVRFTTGDRIWQSDWQPMFDQQNYWATFTIPNNVYNANIGNPVFINYAINPAPANGSTLMFSRYLRVTLR
ncbi:hypothetical protein LZ023_24695 [Pseudomonas silvicola]|nr:hypothetical protein LZ023_24695 [Pseudomonas silvicola]